MGTETIESFKLSTMINEKRRMPRQSFAKWDHMAASVAERKLRRGSAFLPIDTGRPIKSEQTYVFTDEGRKFFYNMYFRWNFKFKYNRYLELITLTPEISVTASSSQLDRADQNGANTEGVAPIISNGSEDSITTPELCSKPSTVPIFERRVSVINARRVSLSQSVGASPENILSKMMDVHKSDDLMEGEGILSGLAKMSFGVTTRQGFKRGSLSAGPGIRRSSLANKSRTQQMF